MESQKTPNSQNNIEQNKPSLLDLQLYKATIIKTPIKIDTQVNKTEQKAQN